MPYLERNRWRVRVWVHGQKFSKAFPPGTPKRVADAYERKLKLSQVDPDLAKKRRLEPTFSEFAQCWLSEHCLVYHSVSYTKTREARSVPIPRQILDYLSNFRGEAGDTPLFPFLTNSFGHIRLKPLMNKANSHA